MHPFTKLAVVASFIALVVACSSDAPKVALGGSCDSVDQCDDNGGTQLRWCCTTATDGRAHVCRATNCFGVK